MIPFFTVECAHIKGAPVVETFLSIKRPSAAVNIPGLKFIPGEKPSVVIGKSGMAWTDCLGSHYSHFPIFLSERVVRAVVKADMKGLKAGEIEIDSRKNRRLVASAHEATYYQVEPLGRPLNFIYRVFEWTNKKYEFRFETRDKTDPILRPMALPYMQQIQKIPLVEKWDGSDFIMVSENFPTYGSGGFYCSRRFVELAKEHQWSNLNFTPIDVIAGRGGDFRERPWPPESWYPENHPPTAQE